MVHVLSYSQQRQINHMNQNIEYIDINQISGNFSVPWILRGVKSKFHCYPKMVLHIDEWRMIVVRMVVIPPREKKNQRLESASFQGYFSALDGNHLLDQGSLKYPFGRDQTIPKCW